LITVGGRFDGSIELRATTNTTLNVEYIVYCTTNAVLKYEFRILL